MIRVIVTLVHGAVYGAIVGLIWWPALGTINALYISALAGGILGIVLGLLSVAASAGRNISERESMVLPGILLMLATMLSGLVGLIVLAYRAFFA